MKVKLTIEYDGSQFHGWQHQDGLVTVQQQLEEALGVFLISQAKKASLAEPEPPGISGSGRTDSGVHARGQVASFPWPAHLPFDGPRLILALNGITHPALSVLSAEAVSDTFDARHSPHLKQYSYHFLLRDEGDSLYRGRALRVGRNLQLKKMITAAKHFAGNHDFSSFRDSTCHSKTTFRTIHASEFTRIDEFTAIFHVRGKGFLKQMVRIMAGTLLKVGRGQLHPDEIPQLLEARDRTLAGDTAPAHGLFLDWVRYEPEEETTEEEESQ